VGCALLRKGEVESKVNGVGQECPTHTGNTDSKINARRKSRFLRCGRNDRV
jgi:ssDNA-binding Zn-finger/Zn-ribbon topoisomerase 1